MNIPKEFYGPIKIATAVAFTGVGIYIATHQFRQIKEGLDDEEIEQPSGTQPVQLAREPTLTSLSSSSSPSPMQDENQNLPPLSHRNTSSSAPSTATTSSSPLPPQEHDIAWEPSWQKSNQVEQFLYCQGSSKSSIKNDDVIFGLPFPIEQEQQDFYIAHGLVDFKSVETDGFQTALSVEQEVHTTHDNEEANSVEVYEYHVVSSRVAPTRVMYEVRAPSESGFEPADIHPDFEETTTKQVIREEFPTIPLKDIYAPLTGEAEHVLNKKRDDAYGVDIHTSPESKKVIKKAKAKVNAWLKNNAHFTHKCVSMSGFPLSIVDVPGNSTIEPPKKHEIMKMVIKNNNRLLDASRYEELLRNPNIQRLRQFGGYLNSSGWPVCTKDSWEANNL